MQLSAFILLAVAQISCYIIPMRNIDNPAIFPSRMTLLFDCFAALGTLKAYGQTQLATEMRIRPQVIRRRAADARKGGPSRGMPVDQIKHMAQIAAREIPPIRALNMGWQFVAAWMIGLDELTHFEKRCVPKISTWLSKHDPRAPERPKRSDPKPYTGKRATAVP